MTVELSNFDPADYLLDEQDVRHFLEASLEDASPEHMARALDAVIRAKGLMQLSAETGISREKLGRILNPAGATTGQDLLEIYEALGVHPGKNSDAA